MRRLVSFICAFMLCTAILNGCGGVKKTPDAEQIKKICELTTLECYYNNVAKLKKEAGSGIAHWFEKDREMWIEYEGYVKLGIDMKKMYVDINEEVITITMPKAEVREIGIVDDTLTENSYAISEDGWLNGNKITADEQTEAIKNAQQKMKEQASANTELLEKAEVRAKKLIENYVNQLGEATGVTYRIQWKVAESSPEVSETKAAA